MEERIKPCPFCGGTAYIGSATFTPGVFTIICDNCNMMIEKYGIDSEGFHQNFPFRTREEAITAWNRRSSDVEA